MTEAGRRLERKRDGVESEPGLKRGKRERAPTQAGAPHTSPLDPCIITGAGAGRPPGACAAAQQSGGREVERARLGRGRTVRPLMRGGERERLHKRVHPQRVLGPSASRRERRPPGAPPAAAQPSGEQGCRFFSQALLRGGWEARQRAPPRPGHPSHALSTPGIRRPIAHASHRKQSHRLPCSPPSAC